MPRTKFVPRSTKVPHLLKSRFRDDIAFRLKFIFFLALCTRHPEQREGTCCMNDSLFFPLIAAGVASVFCLETKGTNAEALLR
jgi:hypothetical protein